MITPFVNEVRSQGLKLGLYYSLLDWSHKDYPNFTKNIVRYKDDEKRWNRFVDFNFAQLTELKEIASIESNDGMLDVFSVPINGERTYFLNVGTLGIGDEIVQINFDPLFKLFIPLGSNLTEAIETLGKLKDMYKEPAGTKTQMEACFAAAVPNDKLETITITRRKVLLSNMLEFAVEREGYIRATHVTKSDLSGILSSVKFYAKLHKKEL